MKTNRLLTETKPGLPSHWYFDPVHHARELDAIWYRDWICVGRLESLEQPGDYRVAQIGTQSIIVTRLKDGGVRAFHNTCRHRGAALCREDKGRFRNGRIVCPYHTWTYSTAGELLATPNRFECEDFDYADFSLYSVHVDTWGGFIFVSLADEPESDLLSFLGSEADMLKNWPLDEMRTVRQDSVEVACNWKIFWENYNECYHCPRVHPELCRVMPVYKHAVFDHKDVPGWTPASADDTGLGSVGESSRTWTLSGHSDLPDIEGLSQHDKDLGVVFASVTGSMYVVGHPDYVRSVRIVPTGPETIRLVVNYLLPEKHATGHVKELDKITELARLVIGQDGEVCELNQKGIHSRRHANSVLMPQEFELWHFHEWLRDKLARAGD